MAKISLILQIANIPGEPISRARGCFSETEQGVQTRRAFRFFDLTVNPRINRRALAKKKAQRISRK